MTEKNNSSRQILIETGVNIYYLISPLSYKLGMALKKRKKKKILGGESELKIVMRKMWEILSVVFIY